MSTIFIACPFRWLRRPSVRARSLPFGRRGAECWRKRTIVKTEECGRAAVDTTSARRGPAARCAAGPAKRKPRQQERGWGVLPGQSPQCWGGEGDRGHGGDNKHRDSRTK